MMNKYEQNMDKSDVFINFNKLNNAEWFISAINQRNNTIRKVMKSIIKKQSQYFDSDKTNIVMCLYNTLGVIPSEKRQRFIDNMRNIAGEKGATILTTFNGDNFDFVAPKMYNPMMPMIKQIDENSFDAENRVFQNGLGFRSQWFTKKELKSMLHSDIEPIPIDVMINQTSYTFGNVFVDRSI